LRSNELPPFRRLDREIFSFRTKNILSGDGNIGLSRPSDFLRAQCQWILDFCLLFLSRASFRGGLDGTSPSLVILENQKKDDEESNQT
jgi:hypothetical protein